MEAAMEEAGGALGRLSETLGSTEPALRLLLSLLCGYPLALAERRWLSGASPPLLCCAHCLTGLAIAAWNFGLDTGHLLLCVLLQYLLLVALGGTAVCVAASFSVQMGYLFLGYYYSATENYDIKWTMPHCVLTLKLIGAAIDFYDGQKKPESLSAEQGDYAQRRCPSLLELAGFGLFYGGLLVGPQFSLRQYLRHCHGELTPSPGQPPQSVAPALARMSLGLFYVVVFAVGGPYFPDSYLLSADYQAQPFWYRCVHLAFWGKIALYKYLCCWLLAEGVCILCGLAYSGHSPDGRSHWDACCNIHVTQFERTALFTGTIASFNTNTNAWVARCVFKRLRWLGSKALSQLCALAFLSVWHGLHSGYAVCFSFEFLVVTVEKQALDLVRRCPALSSLSTSTALRIVLYPPHQLFHCMFMGYPLSAFCLFSYSKWMQVYSSVYFCGHVVFLSLLLLLPLLRLLLLPAAGAAGAQKQQHNSSSSSSRGKQD